jgi:hypothetical protein
VHDAGEPPRARLHQRLGAQAGRRSRCRAGGRRRAGT